MTMNLRTWKYLTLGVVVAGIAIAISREFSTSRNFSTSPNSQAQPSNELDLDSATEIELPKISEPESQRSTAPEIWKNLFATKKMSTPATTYQTPDSTQNSTLEAIASEPVCSESDKRLTLSAGLGSNYLKFDQSNTNAQESGQFSAVTSPTFMAEARLQWNKKWAYSFSYNQMPGKVQTPTSVSINNDNYTWSYFGAEAVRRVGEGPAGTQFFLLGGLQRHQMPFLVGGSVYDVDLIQNQLVTGSLGVRMEWQPQDKWFFESFLRYQAPLSSTSSSGNFKISAATSFDGLVGISRQLSEHWRLGVYWFGQSHTFTYNYSSADNTTERQGTQKLFNSDLQLRFAYQWDLSRP